MAVATMVIVGKGVQSGIEKSVSWMMPGMVIMLLIMIGYGAFSGGFGDALRFLFAFNASSLSSEGMLAAMGHAFFTLSLASGAILTYGSYLPREASIGRTTLTVAVADTLVALMAGLAIFPVIFANGMEPGSGQADLHEPAPGVPGHASGHPVRHPVLRDVVHGGADLVDLHGRGHGVLVDR